MRESLKLEDNCKVDCAKVVAASYHEDVLLIWYMYVL